MQILATWSATASGSEPPDISTFVMLTTPTIIPKLQLVFAGLTYPSAPAAAAVDVWGTDGNGNIFLLQSVPLATTGNQPAAIIDCYVNRISLVPVLTGGSSPTISGKVIVQPVQISVQLAP